jgi:glycosyltransferase involved in cell wall biosynthesis
MTRRTPHTLYLCYFGLHEPLVQTQVLPYLREIRKGGVKVSLVTFEPNFKAAWTKERIASEKKRLAAEDGFEWHCLGYHKRPSVPATAYDILNGARLARQLLRREKFDVIHARVHVPMLMAVLARKFSGRGRDGDKPKLIFDIRGFFPEEYTDAGVWKQNGWLYRATKRVEKYLLKEADAFVVLTEKARSILFPESRETGFDRFGRPVEVIPCCVDLQRFDAADEAARREIREKYNLHDRRVAAYVGSFDGWYLTGEMLDFFQTARERDPRTFTLILTQRDKEKVAARLRQRGFADADFLVESVPPAEIPKYLSASDVALSFIKACYSKQSSSPTKIAEYLAGGVPIVANDGVGDVTELIEGEKVGAVVRGFDAENYRAALEKIETLNADGRLPEKCRQRARKIFHLETVGGEKYRALYRRLLLGTEASVKK